MWSGDIHKSLGKYSDLGTRINTTWSLQILWTRGGTSNIFVPEDTLMVWPRSKDGRFSYPKKSKGSLFRGRSSVRRPWHRWQGFFLGCGISAVDTDEEVTTRKREGWRKKIGGTWPENQPKYQKRKWRRRKRYNVNSVHPCVWSYWFRVVYLRGASRK